MSVLLGVALLARGRADGLQHFSGTTQAFLASLAPLVAFPLVGAVLLLMGRGDVGGFTDLLAATCGLLAPAVVSEWLARRWGREAEWPRYAVAFNWCQWAVPVAAAALLLVLGVFMAAGLPNVVAGNAVLLGLSGYALWLHWFLARHGLSLGVGQAVLFVLLVDLGTGVCVTVPALLASALQ